MVILYRCGHCKNLAPHWASAATELKGKVKLGALDATAETVTAGRFGVSCFYHVFNPWTSNLKNTVAKTVIIITV